MSGLFYIRGVRGGGESLLLAVFVARVREIKTGRARDDDSRARLECLCLTRFSLRRRCKSCDNVSYYFVFFAVGENNLMVKMVVGALVLMLELIGLLVL